MLTLLLRGVEFSRPSDVGSSHIGCTRRLGTWVRVCCVLSCLFEWNYQNEDLHSEKAFFEPVVPSFLPALPLFLCVLEEETSICARNEVLHLVFWLFLYPKLPHTDTPIYRFSAGANEFFFKNYLSSQVAGRQAGRQANKQEMKWLRGSGVAAVRTGFDPSAARVFCFLRLASLLSLGWTSPRAFQKTSQLFACWGRGGEGRSVHQALVDGVHVCCSE